jgi:tetratricopeptide (TPR) repeat protein
LASALGTIEFGAGKTEAGRRLIAASMRRPSENSLAQAAWLERREGHFHPKASALTPSPEVNAWIARLSSDWGGALREFRKWQNGEPFSSRPAFFGSQLAGTAMEDYELAAEIAEKAIISNPDDVSLYNNRAWALALAGRVDEAEAVMTLTKNLGVNDSARIVLTATRGLIAFRKGLVLAGRALYLDAIREARTQRDSLKEYDATIRHAIEEMRAGTPDAEGYKKAGMETARNLTDPIYGPLIKRLVDSKLGGVGA